MQSRLINFDIISLIIISYKTLSFDTKLISYFH
ncbi:hypothetical protein PANT111_40190 [Pantoea brenneri]|uniref:Uncharacterized protein n=1 Tax=Pantoea brenneri TaxID=472694 RepID=A0AAX3JAG8_9GAMM|nr:hypothetical protein PANT111_40190 [Pantoea brenneri]